MSQVAIETRKSEALTLEARASVYRDYSQEQKAEAIAHFQANGQNYSGTSRELNIPQNTLRRWVLEHPELSELREVKSRDLANRLESIAFGLTDSIDEHDLSIVPLASKATSLGIVIDKMQLLRGQPTSISGSVMSDDERKLRLAELIAKVNERNQPASTDPE